LYIYVIAFALAIFAVGLCIKLLNLKKKTGTQSFSDYWKGARKLIDKKLEEEAEKLHFAHYMKYALRGGKRFRGTLTLLFTQALGGNIEDGLPFSVAIEFIHAGVLVHDDFFDMHEIRRGRVPLARASFPKQ
jgi:geranylgeranyl pyrophosphate synthase